MRAHQAVGSLRRTRARLSIIMPIMGDSGGRRFLRVAGRLLTELVLQGCVAPILAILLLGGAIALFSGLSVPWLVVALVILLGLGVLAIVAFVRLHHRRKPPGEG